MKITAESHPRKLTFDVYEGAAHELVELLRLDTSARLGHTRSELSTAEELVLASLRLRKLHEQVTNRARHPRTVSRAAATLRRLITAAMDLTIGGSSFFTDYAAAAERDERLYVAFQKIRDELAAMELQYTPMSSDVPPTRDSMTLADQFLLIACPGSYSSVWHVRLYRPAEQPPVLVLGELVDYHSPGLIESPGQVVNELRRRLPMVFGEQPTLVHYLPCEYVKHSEREAFFLEHESGLPAHDSFRLVGYTANVRQPALRDITTAELEALIDGPVRRWHAADYNAPTLTALGVRTFDSINDATSRDSAGATILFRCRRWRCGIGFDIPLPSLAGASCPRCGSTSMQPIRMVNSE